MKIYLVNNNNGDQKKLIGDHKNLPIPRVGEVVNIGYNPLPKVVDVAYDYNTGYIFVIVDGFITA